MPLCDTLLRAAARGLYQPCWSPQILDEVTRNLVAKGRATAEQAERRRGAILRAFPEAMVVGHERLIDAMPNHAKDRHVAAAAVKAGAQVIVTYNLRDFAVLPDALEARHPDGFLCELLDRSPALLVDVIVRQAADLQQRRVTVEELLARLEPEQPVFVASIRKTPS